MPIPTTGPVSLSQLKSEFNDTGSSSLSEFYRIDGLVPDNASNVSVPRQDTNPEDGQNDTISLSNFRGARDQVISAGAPNLTRETSTIPFITSVYPGTELIVDVENMTIEGGKANIESYLVGFRLESSSLGAADKNGSVVVNGTTIGTNGDDIEVLRSSVTQVDNRDVIPVRYTPSIADGGISIVVDVKIKDVNDDVTVLSGTSSTTQTVSVRSIPDLSITPQPLTISEGSTAEFDVALDSTLATTLDPDVSFTIASTDPRLNTDDKTQTLSLDKNFTPVVHSVRTTSDTTASSGYNPALTNIGVSAQFILGGNPVVSGVIVFGGEANPTIGNYSFTLSEDVSLSVTSPLDENSNPIPNTDTAALVEGRDGFRVDITYSSASGLSPFNVYLDYDIPLQGTTVYPPNGSDTVALIDGVNQLFFGVNRNASDDIGFNDKQIKIYANSNLTNEISEINLKFVEPSKVDFTGQYSGSAVDVSTSSLFGSPILETSFLFLGSSLTTGTPSTTYDVGSVLSSRDGFTGTSTTIQNIGTWVTLPASATDLGDIEYDLNVPSNSLEPGGYDENKALFDVSTIGPITSTQDGQVTVTSNVISSGGSNDSFTYVYNFAPTITEERIQGSSGNGLHPAISDPTNQANDDTQTFDIDHVFTRVGPEFTNSFGQPTAAYITSASADLVTTEFTEADVDVDLQFRTDGTIHEVTTKTLTRTGASQEQSFSDSVIGRWVSSDAVNTNNLISSGIDTFTISNISQINGSMGITGGLFNQPFTGNSIGEARWGLQSSDNSSARTTFDITLGFNGQTETINVTAFVTIVRF